MIDEKGLRRGNIRLGSVGNESLERDGRVDNQIAQRRPRSRAASASAVEMGFRRSDLWIRRVKARRVFGSSVGRVVRTASATAARRTNELRVMPHDFVLKVLLEGE